MSTKTPRSFSAKLLSSWVVKLSSFHQQNMLMPGVVSPRVKDFAFLLVKLQEISVSPFPQVVGVPLNGSMTFWCISHSSQFCVISKIAEGTLSPVVQIINKNV